MVHVPTWRDHVRRALGFRSLVPNVDAKPEAKGMPGWFMTQVNIDISFADRVRFLVSGRARMLIEHRSQHAAVRRGERRGADHPLTFRQARTL